MGEASASPYEVIMRYMDDDVKPFRMLDNYYDPPEEDICAICEADIRILQIEETIVNELTNAGIDNERIRKFKTEISYGTVMDSLYAIIKHAIEQDDHKTCEDHRPLD